MKRIVLAGLVALVTACGSEKEERPIEYGAPQAPALDEQDAAATAQAALQGSLAFAPTSEPASGAPGLADRLVASLGGYAAATTMPTAQTQKLGASAASSALETGGVDPACVTTTETSVTWTGCEETVTQTDPYSTSSITVTVDGTLSWNAATGLTSWNIHETMAMTRTEDGQTMTMNATADLAGAITVTASTIAGDAASSVTVRGSYMGLPLDSGIRTTLALDLGYQAEPFCITSGTLLLEQRWTERPMGATEVSAPNQGWRFEWTGCGAFTVAHGS